MKSLARYNTPAYRALAAFAMVALVFFWMAYYSVPPVAPNALPAHHGDYSNYSLGAAGPLVERLDLPKELAPLVVIVISIPLTFVMTRWILCRP